MRSESIILGTLLYLVALCFIQIANIDVDLELVSVKSRFLVVQADSSYFPASFYHLCLDCPERKSIETGNGNVFVTSNQLEHITNDLAFT